MISIVLRPTLACLILLATPPAMAMDPPPHPAEIAIRDYVMAQTRGSGKRVEVAVDRLPQSILQRPCSAYVPTLPAGTRLWGRSVVALNCAAPQSWVVYAPVKIAVHGRYLKTARAIASGQVLTSGDFVLTEGDLTDLPDGTFTQASEALGLRTRVGIAADLPLGKNHVIVPPVVRQGDPVRVLARGPGFAASGEGKALANAAEGDTVRVRMPSGQTVTGVARKGGIVELPN